MKPEAERKSQLMRVVELDDTKAWQVLFSIAIEHPNVVAAVLDRIGTSPENLGQSLGPVTIDTAGQVFASNDGNSNGIQVGYEAIRTRQSLSSQRYQ